MTVVNQQAITTSTIRTSIHNFKNELQEYAQGHGGSMPVYHLVSKEGVEHAPTFTVACILKSFTKIGKGSTVKSAEQDAAKNVLESIQAAVANEERVVSRSRAYGKASRSDPTTNERVLRCLQRLQHRLDLPDFVNFANLKRALTHASLESEQHYQRLEFLGDAILRMLIIDYLLRQYPKIIDKAFLSPCVDELVSAQTQIKIAKKLGLKQSIFSAVPISDSMLSDVLEALIAAIYIDGQDRVVSIIISWFKPEIRKRFGEDDLRESRKAGSDYFPSLMTGTVIPKTSRSVSTPLHSYSEVFAPGQQTMKRQKTLLWSASKKTAEDFPELKATTLEKKLKFNSGK